VRVTGLLETFVTEVERAVNAVGRTAVLGTTARPAPVTVVTGANGFLGSRIVRSLESVRGIGRSSAAPDDGPAGMPWVAADLSRSVPVAALAGAEVVIHAAAETAGDFDAHQRNTIDATRHLLQAMHASGVSRLVLVSSLSVVRPPRSLWECQDESTPRPADAARLGPYTWGKTSQEALVEREAAALGIATRIVRPGALVDAARPEVPGLLGRRVFGRWHLGLGRPSLPIAACDVDRCARAIAWCATHFDDAPPIVNLFEPSTATRGALAAWMRARGWNGRIVWVPISVIAAGMSAARGAHALAHGRRPSRLAVWSILRARRFDPHVSAALLAASDGLRCHPAPNTTVPAIAGYRSGSSVALGEPT
jgi:nucleoside-diphosphate-sugar epimerase